MPKITRIVIKDFRSIRKLDITVPKAGIVVKGANAKGKTSVLKALSSVLAAQELGPDSVRIGEDQAEILVDLDALRLRRTITPRSSQLTVTTKEGDRWTKPQGRLTELIGTAGIDPLSFFLSDPKERRRQVLDAIPVDVSFADIDRWTNGGAAALGFAPDHVEKGTGLDAVEQLRATFYERRTEANRVAKAARAAADADRDVVDAIPKDDLGPAPGENVAKKDVQAAQARVDEMRGRQAGAAAAREASEKTRARITELELEARSIIDGARPEPSQADRVGAQVRVDMAEQRVEEIKKQLAEAEAVAATAREHVEALEERTKARAAAEQRAAEIRGQADQLQASVASVEAMAVSAADIDQANADLENAERVYRHSLAAAAAAAAITKANASRDTARAREDEADKLDEIVKTLTTEAPRELAGRSNLIPGIAFEGDKITLDGVPIDGLSGAEQMRFAVDLARRLNAKGKILVVDGLERLDAGRMVEFIKMATADDFQLFATKVENGDLVVEAIES